MQPLSSHTKCGLRDKSEEKKKKTGFETFTKIQGRAALRAEQGQAKWRDGPDGMTPPPKEKCPPEDPVFSPEPAAAVRTETPFKKKQNGRDFQDSFMYRPLEISESLQKMSPT